MFTNYDGVLKVDGEVGNKKAYDPRSYLKAAEQGMAARVVDRLREPPLDGAHARHVITSRAHRVPATGAPRASDRPRGPVARSGWAVAG